MSERWCTYCGIKFAREEHLVRHIYTHTQVKPFVCKYCFLSFNRRDLLQRHYGVHGRDENNQVAVQPPNLGGSPEGLSRTPIACNHCAKSKTKCDRQSPCSRCTKRNLECTSRGTRRTIKRPRNESDAGDGSCGGINGDARNVKTPDTLNSDPVSPQSMASGALTSIRSGIEMDQARIEEGLSSDIDGTIDNAEAPDTPNSDQASLQPVSSSAWDYPDNGLIDEPSGERSGFDFEQSRVSMQSWAAVPQITDSNVQNRHLQLDHVKYANHTGHYPEQTSAQYANQPGHYHQSAQVQDANHPSHRDQPVLIQYTNYPVPSLELAPVQYAHYQAHHPEPMPVQYLNHQVHHLQQLPDDPLSSEDGETIDPFLLDLRNGGHLSQEYGLISPIVTPVEQTTVPKFQSGTIHIIPDTHEWEVL